MSSVISGFYGWKLARITCLSNIFVQGLGIYILNALIDPFTAAYGWTRGGMGISLGIGAVCSTLAIPPLSALAQRIGLKNTMICGSLLGGSAVMLMGLTPHLWLFTLLFSLVWIAGQACGGAIGNALMSNWFVNFRGRAFGLVNVGTSFSGVVTPLMVHLLVDHVGLQAALGITGVAVWLITLPCIFLFVRDTPEEMGLLPDGGTPVTPASPAKAEEGDDAAPSMAPTASGPEKAKTFTAVSIPLAELFHSFKANRIGLAYGLGMMMSGGVVSQLKPLFTDLGFADMEAMGLMALCTFFAAAGKFGWGWLSDRLGALRAARMMFLWSSVGLSLAFLPASWWTMALFAVIAGFGMGGFWTSFPTVVAFVYGRQKFLSAYRYLSVFGMLRAVGYVIIGWSSQYAGSYGPAYAFFLLATFAAYGCLHGLGDKDKE